MFILMCNSFDFILHDIQLKCTNYKHCFRIPANIMLLWIKQTSHLSSLIPGFLTVGTIYWTCIPFERNSTLDDV